MTVTKVEIRSGAYYDSVVLMLLQRALSEVPGVIDAGVVMGTDANKDVLAQSNLLTAEGKAANPDDMLIVVKAEDDAAADAALAQVDDLLAKRSGGGVEAEYMPKSIEAAVDMLPQSQWVLVSVPGRYAAGVARQALQHNRHVFLYSDNVSLDDEISLKKEATAKGLLVMGPDCGTAIVNGIGLGFANRVRRGAIGVVAASGTGLQQTTARIHQMGGGITHALGTGGRDLKEAVGAITARQGLQLLIDDPDTSVIVLVSKPPAPTVAEALLTLARSTQKPVVVDFIGYTPPARRMDNLYFVSTVDEAAEMAVSLAENPPVDEPLPLDKFAEGQKYLRGLFSGGTLAFEAQLILKDYLPNVLSNAPLDSSFKMKDALVSEGNCIIDLGEDEFTVGRLHPMMDNDLRIRRLLKEAEDPAVAVILLDVVLGDGAHMNPAGELAPAIARAKKIAADAGRHLEVVAVVVGTDADPQGMDEQIAMLKDAGAHVDTSNDAATRYVGSLIRALNPAEESTAEKLPPVDGAFLSQPLAAINAGLQSFTDAVIDQGAEALQMDWRPPAGGNERLMAILAKMKG